MKTSPVLLIGAAALVASLVGVTQGCSSATQSFDGQGGTGSVTAGTGGTGITTPPMGTGGSGSAPVGGAISCDPANPNPICEGINTDANCNTTNASTDAACTKDCAVECGFDGMGLKICSCEGGIVRELSLHASEGVPGHSNRRLLHDARRQRPGRHARRPAAAPRSGHNASARTT